LALFLYVNVTDLFLACGQQIISGQEIIAAKKS
jgi:hypothetical protein